jgi:hypothetical protein
MRRACRGLPLLSLEECHAARRITRPEGTLLLSGRAGAVTVAIERPAVLSPGKRCSGPDKTREGERSMHRARQSWLFPVVVLAVSGLAVGCGAKQAAPPGGGFMTAEEREAAAASAARARESGRTAPSPRRAAAGGRFGEAVEEEGVSAVQREVDEYVQRAREYESEEAERRQAEIEAMPEPDVWIALEPGAAQAAQAGAMEGQAAPAIAPGVGSVALSQFPLDLQVGQTIRIIRAGSARTRYEAGQIMSIELHGWRLQGLGGQPLATQQSGTARIWQDQPFEVYYGGSLVRRFSNTAEFRAAIAG